MLTVGLLDRLRQIVLNHEERGQLELTGRLSNFADDVLVGCGTLVVGLELSLSL